MDQNCGCLVSSIVTRKLILIQNLNCNSKKSIQTKTRYFSFGKNRVFSFDSSTVQSAADKLNNDQRRVSQNCETSEPLQQETQSDIQVSVTPTTLETSSPSDDTTIQVYHKFRLLPNVSIFFFFSIIVKVKRTYQRWYLYNTQTHTASTYMLIKDEVFRPEGRDDIAGHRFRAPRRLPGLRRRQVRQRPEDEPAARQLQQQHRQLGQHDVGLVRLEERRRQEQRERNR